MRYIDVYRGDIFYADLSPVVGSEQGGTRPVLVIQNDVGNRFSPTVIVAPLTSQSKNNLPTHTTITGFGLAEESIVLCEQVRTISKRRLKEKRGHVPPEIMERIEPALEISMGLRKEEKKTNELIPVSYGSDRPTVSARELHKFLGVETRFNDWFPRMAEYGFSEGTDYYSFLSNGDGFGKAATRTDYQLTLDMAKELCMIQRTERGKQARKYFLEVEKNWNSPEKVMARALEFAHHEIHGLEERIEADKPKVLFADSVCASKSSILVGEMAKLLKQNGIEIGEKRFFHWLRQNGYLISRYGTDYNMPTQKSMDLKIFEVKETSITHASGTVTVSKTPKINGKGQKYFINKFLKEQGRTDKT